MRRRLLPSQPPSQGRHSQGPRFPLPLQFPASLGASPAAAAAPCPGLLLLLLLLALFLKLVLPQTAHANERQPGPQLLCLGGLRQARPPSPLHCLLRLLRLVSLLGTLQDLHGGGSVEYLASSVTLLWRPCRCAEKAVRRGSLLGTLPCQAGCWHRTASRALETDASHPLQLQARLETGGPVGREAPRSQPPSCPEKSTKCHAPSMAEIPSHPGRAAALRASYLHLRQQAPDAQRQAGGRARRQLPRRQGTAVGAGPQAGCGHRGGRPSCLRAAGAIQQGGLPQQPTHRGGHRSILACQRGTETKRVHCSSCLLDGRAFKTGRAHRTAHRQRAMKPAEPSSYTCFCRHQQPGHLLAAQTNWIHPRLGKRPRAPSPRPHKPLFRSLPAAPAHRPHHRDPQPGPGAAPQGGQGWMLRCRGGWRRGGPAGARPRPGRPAVPALASGPPACRGDGPSPAQLRPGREGI
jgi:hypothetical protein